MKKMKMKRGLSVFLCMLFCVGLMPAKAYAEEPSSQLLIANRNILEEPDQRMELGDGTAEYDEETNTLTLNNATITSEGSGNTNGVISIGEGDLTIELIGQNTITSGSYCGIVGSHGTLTIQGEGSLAINSVYYGIREGRGNISINGITLNIEVGSAGPFMGNGMQAEGILEITGGANVTTTATMPSTIGLNGNKGLVITDSTVTVNLLSEEGYNNALTSDNDISITKSIVTANNMTKMETPAIVGGNVKISNGSDVTAYSASSNAIHAFDHSNSGISAGIEITDSKFTSTSAYPGLAADDIIIDNSTANVESTANSGIFARHDLTIKGNSDITSRGAKKAISVKNTFKLIPPEGQLMDVFVGENEEDAAVIEESPLSQETDLTHYGKNGITYFRSTLHNHSWGDWESNGDNTHKRICVFCKAEETANCSGGTATCSTPAICEVCEGKYGEVDAANHTNLVKVDAKPATESKAGNKEFWYCDGCNKYFSDKDAAKEIAYEDTVIPKLSGNDNEGREEGNKDVPKTGDTSNGVLWGIVMLTAGAVLLSSISAKKRNL